MYPSCSNFGLKAFTETNFASAFILTSDRLLRCGHDRDNYAFTLRKTGFKLLDYPAYDPAPKELYYQRNTYYFAYSDSIRDDSTQLFIKKLINNQYYREALLEIMRIEFQSVIFNIELFINKIICFHALGEYEKALFEYETKCPPPYKSNAELAYQIALIQYELQNYKEAIRVNSITSKSCLDIYCQSKALLLEGLLYAKLYNWQGSMDAYQMLSGYDTYQNVAKVNLALAKNGLNYKGKSPGLAGVLSIIPGLGYAYSGHKGTAISAFLINGLLAYATYTSFKNENYGLGILTGVFNLSFYIGNIYGGVKSAKRYNEQNKKSIINKLKFNSNL